MRIAGRERLIAAEDAGLYRDAIGARAPARPAGRLRRAGRGALARLALRHARTHGPFTADELRERLGVDPLPALEELAVARRAAARRLPPRRRSEEWVAPDVLRRVRRRTLAALRKRWSRSTATRWCRFLPAWHGIGRDLGRGPDRVREVVSQLGGVACRSRPGRRTCCRCGSRLPAGRPRRAVRRRRGWSGSAPAGTGSRSTCARTRRCCSRRRSRASTRSWTRSGRRARFLPRPAGGAGRHRARAAGRHVGAGLGRAGDQRQLAAAARGRPSAGRAAAAGPPRARPTASCPRRRAAGRPSTGCSSRQPSSATAPGRWPRRCSTATACSPAPAVAGGGHPRRLLVGLRRAAADGGGRAVPARVLRRGPGRRAVRAAGGRRAAARRAVDRLRR